jgi:predicted MFS family arabinose efflux permease
LLFGNFVIGCGVMVVSGTLNNLTQSLGVSVPVGGQLITLASIVMGASAPLLAGVVAGWDRRKLLTLAMLWYAVGHALCAWAPDYASLLPLRAATMLSAAVFTPQAAAAAGFVARPEQRGRAITFVFLGWSLASVLGMPIATWVGEHFGWRVAMSAIAAASLLAAGSVHLFVPRGIKPAAVPLSAWREVLTHPVLMAVVLVTAMQSAGQITVLAYAAPYFKQVLHATPEQISLLYGWLGACGFTGNVLLSRHVDRVGPAHAVGVTLLLIACSQLLWTSAGSMLMLGLVIVPWGLGNFATNSAQQARLGSLLPAVAPALLALNTSAIYLGQAAGAAGGGALLATSGFNALHWAGMAWLLSAWLLSRWAARRQSASDLI